MKNIFNYPTMLFKGVIFLNDMKKMILNPIAKIRDIIKLLIIKTIISIIKQIIKLTFLKEKKDYENNLILKQLNAMVDKEANTKGISKTITFEITPDIILKEIIITNDKEILKRIRNIYGNLKNGLRNQIYEYITENNFENLGMIFEGVNSIMNTPTELVGLEFINSTVNILEHDPIKKDFKIIVNTKIGLKAV